MKNLLTKSNFCKIEENKKPAKPKSSFQKKLKNTKKTRAKMRARQKEKIKNSYILLKKASLLFVYHHLNYNKFDLSNNG